MTKMIKIRRESHPADVTQIQHAIIHHGHLDCSRAQAADAWRAYSDSLCAGWLIVDCYDQASIWRAVEPFIEVEDE